jgi:hypothetical protein
MADGEEVDLEVDNLVASVENERDDEKESLSPILDLVSGEEAKNGNGVYRSICLEKATWTTTTLEIVSVGARMMPRVDESVNEIVVFVTRSGEEESEHVRWDVLW